MADSPEPSPTRSARLMEHATRVVVEEVERRALRRERRERVPGKFTRLQLCPAGISQALPMQHYMHVLSSHLPQPHPIESSLSSYNGTTEGESKMGNTHAVKLWRGGCVSLSCQRDMGGSLVSPEVTRPA